MEVPINVKERIKQFQKQQGKCFALVLRIKDMKLEIESDITVGSVEEAAECLPDNSPRYVLITYPRQKQTLTYPMVLVFVCPESSSNVSKMMYASSYPTMKQYSLGKECELTELTEEALNKLY